MIPDAHIFEGSADNYPFVNALTTEQFQDDEINVYPGPMITVLGTSLYLLRCSLTICILRI